MVREQALLKKPEVEVKSTQTAATDNEEEISRPCSKDNEEEKRSSESSDEQQIRAFRTLA